MSDGDMKFVGGTLCLDFVNTVDAWVDPADGIRAQHDGDTVVTEKLVDYAALVSWGQQAGVLSDHAARHLRRESADRDRDAAKALDRALLLRRALYRIFKFVLKCWEPKGTDIAILQRELTLARMHERLTYRADAFHWTWDIPPEALDQMLWPVSRSAADLMTSTALGILRQCKGEECGWLFLDTSRNRTRQWCDMSDCGNLAKVRKFRMRAKGATKPDLVGD